MVQLYETMLTRHCTMLVGPTGGGKTVVLDTLVKAQTAMGMPTKCVTLNPKVGIFLLLQVFCLMSSSGNLRRRRRRFFFERGCQLGAF